MVSLSRLQFSISVLVVCLGGACSSESDDSGKPASSDAGNGATGGGGGEKEESAGGQDSVGGASDDSSVGGDSSSEGGSSPENSSGGRLSTGGDGEGAAPGGGGSGGDATTGGSPGSGGAQSSNSWSTIENGGYRKDESGERIEAHGGGFLHQGDTWYWIGEDKSHNSGTFRAVNCYASKDLENWEFINSIITRETASKLEEAERIIERPKLVLNENTGRYVMWLHWEGENYADAEAGVFSSETVCGDYSYHQNFRPYNNMSRDDTLFVDDDGTGYFISAANENRDLIIYELTDDYLDVSRQVITLWESSWREAPALFKHEGTYFLITSGATGWDPNQAQYSYATSMDGPWASLRDLGDGTTFDTQPTYVIPVVGSEKTTFIYAGDRWQDPDLQSSKYIWLPLEVEGNNLSLNFYDRWRINIKTGEWNTEDEFIPSDDWTLLFVDSEETMSEDGAAANAFDGSSSTRWHTGYGDSTPEHPHSLEIDLGAAYLIDAMRHLPRQDTDENGIIADYEFYVSDSTSEWGDPVASGTFTNDENDRNGTLVDFSPKAGRYIRFVALSEYNGDAFTSLAELDVRGELL